MIIKNLQQIRERYLKNSLSVRLGSIAANLARIASFSDNPQHSKVIESMIEESKFFIEWTAPDAEIYIQEKLITLQIELARWQLSWKKIWNDEFKKREIVQQSKIWSDNILNLAGF